MATQIGEASVALKFDTDSATSELNSFASSSKSTFSAWTVAVGNLIASAFEKVSDAIGDGLEGGIERLDTLERFPRVMESIGYSAEDASDTVNKLQEYVTGLPTAMDDATSAVQRLAQSSSSLNEATNTYEAMNNALLSGGSSIERQAQVMEQWLQAVSRGKFQGTEWNDMMETMPAVIGQASKELLGSEASAQQLGDALSDGTITMDRFMDEVEKLNTEGADGFAPLSDTAKTATQGIATSFTVLKQNIEKAWQAILDAIGSENIQNAIQGVTQWVKGATQSLVDLVNWAKENKDWLVPLTEGVLAFVSALIAVNKVVVVFSSIKKAIGGIGSVVGLLGGGWALIIAGVIAVAAVVIANWDKIKPVLDAVVSAVQDIWDKVVEVWNGIMKTLSPVFEWINTNVVQPIRSVIQMVIAAIQLAITILVWWFQNFVLPVAQFVYTNVVRPIISQVQNLVSFIKGIIQAVVNFFQAVILPVVQWLWNNCLAPIVQFTEGACDTAKELFDALRLAFQGDMSGMKDFANGVLNGVKGFFSNAFNSAKNVANSAINGIKGFLSGLKSTAASVADGLKNNFVSGFNNVKSKIKSFIDDIVKWFQELPSKMGGIGHNLVEGLWNGISDMGSWISKKISSFGSGVLDSLKSFFGISSPSKLMAEQGVYISQGLAEGILAGGKSATEAMTSLGSDMMANASFNTSVSASGMEAPSMIAVPTTTAYASLDEVRETGATTRSEGIIINMTNQINNDMDADDIGRRIMSSIRRTTI